MIQNPDTTGTNLALACLFFDRYMFCSLAYLSNPEVLAFPFWDAHSLYALSSFCLGFGLPIGFEHALDSLNTYKIHFFNKFLFFLNVEFGMTQFQDSALNGLDIPLQSGNAIRQCHST